jgi:RNA polymerase sigma factor (sigma-70 family)
MIHTDQRYIEALIANDYAVIEEIYQRFLPRINRMVTGNSGSEMDAADIFQEALLMIYRKAVNDRFTLTCPMEAFLYLVCRNRWINELHRRKNKSVTITGEEGFDTGQDSTLNYQQFIIQEERRQLVEEKLKQLDDGCRKLLQLSWSGKSLEEVAGLLNFSYAYVRKKKSGCMSRLMQLVRSSERYQALQW